MTIPAVNENPPAPLRRRRGWRITAIIAGIAIALLGGAYYLFRSVERTVMDAYAVWRAADLVIQHLETHHGAWPRSWEELHATERSAHQGVASTKLDGSWTAEFRPRASIEELRTRVMIDFHVDPTQPLAHPPLSNGPPFRVIYLRDGRRQHFVGKEPNAMIREYLQWKARQDTVFITP